MLITLRERLDRRACCALFALLAGSAQAQTGADIAAAERALAAALMDGSAASLGPWLDAELAWTTAAGRTLSAAEVTQRLPDPLIANFRHAMTTEHDYGTVTVLQSHDERAHVVRVWVRRDAGWRLLAYQEVQLLAAPPTVTPGTGGDCENPCRTLGIDPANATQAAVIKAYQELEIAAEERDIELWSARIADEFVAVSSNGDRLFDKPSRIAGLRQNAMRGLSPTPLVSGRIHDLGDAAVMVSEHLPNIGRPLHVTRVWVRREGQWVETLSYQTARQAE
jgi:hypothetical protein